MIKLVLLTAIGGACFSSIVLSSHFYNSRIKDYLLNFYSFNCDVCISFLINFLWNLIFLFNKISFIYIISISPIFSLLTMVILFILNKLEEGVKDD